MRVHHQSLRACAGWSCSQEATSPGFRVTRPGFTVTIDSSVATAGQCSTERWRRRSCYLTPAGQPFSGASSLTFGAQDRVLMQERRIRIPLHPPRRSILASFGARPVRVICRSGQRFTYAARSSLAHSTPASLSGDDDPLALDRPMARHPRRWSWLKNAGANVISHSV
jgi:hypothetical protein